MIEYISSSGRKITPQTIIDEQYAAFQKDPDWFVYPNWGNKGKHWYIFLISAWKGNIAESWKQFKACKIPEGFRLVKYTEHNQQTHIALVQEIPKEVKS